MPVAEPSAAALSNPLLRYFLATRPPFLSVTLFACLIGFSTARYSGIALSYGTAAATLLFALIAHAGVNVFNDYYDELNGTDRLNTDRVFPFTGGSRFIQNEVLTARQVLAFAVLLFATVIVAGLWLARLSGPGLIGIGMAGLFIGWAYSAPPLQLNSRGFGEPCVAAGFALIVIGTDYVQRAGFAALPAIAAVSYALLVLNILYINQFPDRRADEAAGKRHWVVLLGSARARWGYLVVASCAYLWLAGAVLAGALPGLALLALCSAPMSWRAAADLLRHADQPKELVSAIKLTIGAAALHGLLLASGIALAR